MKGRVKRYNESKGFGFILGEDEKDYFFHCSELKTIDNVERGSMVEFLPTTGEKGLVAKSINIISTNKISKFVNFDDTRIKLSNIKNYGVNRWEQKYTYEFTPSEMRVREAAYNRDTSTLRKTVDKGFAAIGNTLSIISFLGGGDTCFMSTGPDSSEERVRIRKILYVTTYQNDNYEFVDNEVKFDIDKKLKELDELFSS